MPGIKQEALALQPGDDRSQRKISLLEQKESIDAPLLQQLAGPLKIPIEAIRNFDEEAAIINIQNNYEGAKPTTGPIGNVEVQNNECNLNPPDKLMEVMDENKKLYEELLKATDEHITLLERTASK